MTRPEVARSASIVVVLSLTGCFTPNQMSADQTGSSVGTSASSGTTQPGTTIDPAVDTDPSTSPAGSTTSTDESTTGSDTTGSDTTGSDTTGAASKTEGGESTGSSDCRAGTACVPAAPADWQGPGRLFPAEGGQDSPPNCSTDEYPLLGTSGWESFDEGSASCDCDCATPFGLSCNFSLGFGFDEVCGDLDGGFSGLAAAECQLAGFGQGQSYQSASVTTSYVNDGAGCTPIASEVLPDVQSEDASSLCMPRAFGETCAGRAAHASQPKLMRVTASTERATTLALAEPTSWTV